jgi:RNA-directed DNA polymerase
MSAREKSDLPEVAEKRANKAVSAAAELVERRGGAKENAELQSTVRTQSRAAVSQAQARIREAVIRNRQDKLTALLHHLTVDVLRASFFGLKKSAAPGVDEMTWTEYAEDLEENLSDLHCRVQAGAYRALPSRRTYIPKADGRQRPLGIAALEDKIVQAAVVAILTPIYEAEFLGFSYGFRPKRNQHQALDALVFGIGRRRINWVLDYFVVPHLVDPQRWRQNPKPRWGGPEMPAESEQEKRERQQREREQMRQAIASYKGPITLCPPGRSTNVQPRRRGEQKKTPTGSENTP